MFKGFREFILRGNVIDLAVAVVIGTAFTGIVNAIVTNVLNPAIGAIFNAESLSKALPIVLRPDLENPPIIYLGAVLAAIINFLLVAIVVYFALVLPINYLQKNAFWRKEAGQPAVAKDTPPTELELLTDIRDLLAQRPSGTTTGEGKHTP